MTGSGKKRNMTQKRQRKTTDPGRKTDRQADKQEPRRAAAGERRRTKETERLLCELRPRQAGLKKQNGEVHQNDKAGEWQRVAELEAIFAAQIDAMLIYDTGMNVRMATPSFLSIYGFDPLGLNVKEIVQRVACRWLDGRPLKWAEQPTPRAIKGEKVRGATYQVKRGDGSAAVVETSAGPIYMGDRITGSVTVWHDITERKRMEEALEKAHEELEKEVEERTAKLHAALSEIKQMKDQVEAESVYLRQEITKRHQYDHIIGQSAGLKYVLYRAEQVAPRNTTVLIRGETGTGKELIAAVIHDMSPRKNRLLVTVNCAALPANLMESELFGHEKGAFTGADTRQIGRFEVANGSTLCLDEIGELPLELQAKLLRVIQHNEFERLGSSKTIKVDVRIVATTNRDLEEEIRKGRFRQDLYYRLDVFPITVPPLRQRAEDIPMLVQAFIERYSRELGKQITSVTKETMKRLQNYPWPGNIRELESIVERAVILSPGPSLQLDERLEIASPPVATTLKTLEEMERYQILKTLAETQWRIEGGNGAAEILGLHPSTLRSRMRKLGIARPEPQGAD
jgi:formate hydrogenlyase transcriptional activator